MIQTKGLAMRFADGTAIHYQDLSFEAGHSYALLGASGCGKTTLLNLIAGVLRPSEGEILFDGEPVGGWTQKKRDTFRIHQIGYIYQDFKLLDEMTVRDNIDILRLEDVDTRDADALLERLGIWKLRRRRVRSLSGGEKQRVAIARALIKKPRIVLADEPTGNLNFEVGSAVMDQLMENLGGGMLIAVTHDDRLAPRFDHVLDMNQIARGEVDA